MRLKTFPWYYPYCAKSQINPKNSIPYTIVPNIPPSLASVYETASVSTIPHYDMRYKYGEVISHASDNLPFPCI